MSGPLEVFWYVIGQDGRYPWHPRFQRTVDYAYTGALARSLDHLGFDGALFATHVGTGPDPWITTASLIPFTERLRFLVAVHPSLTTPVTFAKMAGTFAELSRDRLLVNVISGGGDFTAVGVPWDHDERYAHTDEFLTVYRRLAAGETVDFSGRYVTVKGGLPPFPDADRPPPPLWFGGSSAPAIEVAAKHIDTYLTWGETPDLLADKVARVRAAAAARGRTLRFGLRINVIVRDTREAAWAAAQDALDHMDDETIAAVHAMTGALQSVGMDRQQGLYPLRKPDDARELEVAPDLWAGLALVRPGPGFALVGDPDTVTARLLEYRDIGFDVFILSGSPLLEEAYRVGEDLLPRLRAAVPAAPAVPAGAG